jgi:hypothetical protein
MPSTWNTLLRSDCHGDSAQVSCTPEGGLRPQGGDNRQRNQDNQGGHGNWQGQQSACGNIDQEVQQPPRPLCSQHTTRPQSEAQPEASLQNAPTADLSQNNNDGHDSQCIIEAKRRDRRDRYHDADDSDCFPAFTSNIIDHSYPQQLQTYQHPQVRWQARPTLVDSLLLCCHRGDRWIQ